MGYDIRGDGSESAEKLREYVDALETELGKIEMFQRELPLSVQLVRHAIESCKQQMLAENLFSGPSDGELSSMEGPVLEEFIPLKRNEECRSHSYEGGDDHDGDRPAAKKPDWLKSVQLWSQDTNPPTEQDKRPIIEPKKSNGAFHPFCKDDKSTKTAAPPAMAASSTADSGERESKENTQAGQRKARRCWSPELHKRFTHALEQLGGPHVATPKQIRDLMKVDGLTNDEVKSHLQKYRLHNRRPASSPAAQNSPSNPQAPQFVVLYAAAAVPTSPPSEANSDGRTKEQIYAPKAAFPNSTRKHQEKMLQLTSFGQVRSGGRSCYAKSNSPATSTTSHVTASSPVA